MKRIFLTLLVVCASFSAHGQTCTGSDSFSGSGSLGSCWTLSSGSSFSKSAGVITGSGYAIYTGTTFTGPQSAQVTVNWASYTGPCLIDTSATGRCYFPNINKIYNTVNGAGIGTAADCSPSSSGDVVRLINDAGANKLSVFDVTTSTELCSTSQAVGGLIPGFTVAGSDTVQFFVGATSSSTVAQPTFSPGGIGPTWRLPTGGATVDVTCTTGTSYYTTDGTTPTISSTPGSSVSITSATTLKSICNDGTTSSDVTSVAYTVGSITIYVNKIGGTRYSSHATGGQCNGSANVAYPGSGANQNCAYSDLRYIWDDENTYGSENWAITGGDTVIISKDSYRIGFDSTTDTTHCIGWASSHLCFPNGIPSGTPGHPTRFLGENYGACSTTRTVINPVNGVPVQVSQADLTKTTEIFGGFDLLTLFDLSGVHDIEFRCVQLDTHNTEHCSTHGTMIGGGTPPETPACTADSPDVHYGFIENYQSVNVTYDNLDIHGFSNDGIRGEFGAGVVASNIHLGYINGACWNMSGPFGDHANGVGATLTLSDFILEWCGFVEEYPAVHAIPIVVGFSQDTQSQDADGIAAQEGASFDLTATRGVSQYNTEDAFDLLHLDAPSSTNTVLIDRLAAWGNLAGTLKWGGAATSRTIQNSFLMANCMRLTASMTGTPSTYNQYLQNWCRANDTSAGGYNNSSTINYLNNTIVGAMDSMFDFTCGNASGTNFGAGKLSSTLGS